MGDFQLGRFLRDWLDANGVSQKELARRANLTEPVVSNLCSGKRKGDWDTLTKLARGLDMTRAQLVAAVDGQPPPPTDNGRHTLTALRYDPNLSTSDADQLITLYQHFRRPRP